MFYVVTFNFCMAIKTNWQSIFFRIIIIFTDMMKFYFGPTEFFTDTAMSSATNKHSLYSFFSKFLSCHFKLLSAQKLHNAMNPVG